MPIQKVGDWNKAAAVLPGLAPRLQKAMNQAVLQLAQEMRKEVLEAFEKEGTPGKPWAPLSPLTLALRKFRGGTGAGGTKILQVAGTLRNAVDVVKGPAGVFLGIKRSAKTRDGKSLVNVGMVQEFGATIHMTMTPKMRRYLAAAMKASGVRPHAGGGAKGKGATSITIHIPARPFLGPIVEAWTDHPDRMEKELMERLAKLLDGDLGRP